MTKLQHVLSQMHDQAAANPGSKISRILSNRLQIDLLQVGNEIRFQIHRSGVYPSADEWRIVMRAIPYPIVTKPVQQHHKERYYLKACWPVQIRMNLEGVAE
jgi:hypothetical protein